MKRVVLCFALFALVACGKEIVDPRPEVHTESFETITEVEHIYGFATDEFEFEYFYNEEYGYWGGFAETKLFDTNAANGKYENQYAVYNEGAADGCAALLYYYDSYNEPCDIVLKGSYELQSVCLNLSTYTYASITDEAINDFARVFVDGDYLKVTFTAMTGDTVGNSVDCYVVDYRDGKRFMATDWNEFNLMGLGLGYDRVRLTIETTDVGEWGANTPLYICLDKLQYI